MKWLVTGGAGFIGSAFVRMVTEIRPDVELWNLDKLSYSGNLENVSSVSDSPQYRFARVDLADGDEVREFFKEVRPDVVFHFAAESHVDRSILAPTPFIESNVWGMYNLLESARQTGVQRFIHVSTDEVYGSIPPREEATEDYPLRTSSPYSASKASSDLLALSYQTTFGLPVSVTRASNNYGPYQFPEKLIPLMITNALEGKPMPIYGNGMQVRDWLYVDDHCRALLAVMERGEPGEVYNIGGSCSLTNLEVVRRILVATGAPTSLVRKVKDRPGHDKRYALSSEKLRNTTGWRPLVGFDDGLRRTINWYQASEGWVKRVKSGEYRTFYNNNYSIRSELETGTAHA
jgi:dTDP-glucose 4,6-dehydratase